MGEAKQEEPKVDETKPEEKKEEKAEEKKEEKAEEKKEEKAEEKKEEEKPSPPAPTVLHIDLHCVGCAKKIQRCILTCRGVESVEMDMGQNQVTVEGIVDPQVLCTRLRKKTMRDVKVLSPTPEAQQVNVISTTELRVNMHCEACAQQLRKNILKMRGVQTVETELSSGKVTVTGTMNADRLVEYVYRRTRKQAKIVPQPKPKEEEKKEEGDTKAEEEKPVEEEKKEEVDKKEIEEEKKEELKEDSKEKGGGGGGDGVVKDEKPAEGGGGNGGGDGEEEKKDGEVVEVIQTASTVEDDMVKRMMYWPPTVYVIERLPPPQLFSDENPNACCIS